MTESKAQDEILKALTQDFKTIKQITKERNISHQAVYKIIGKLKKKGIYQGGCKRGLQSRGYPSRGGLQTTYISNGKQIRLHGIEYNIKIISKDEQYREIIKQTNNLVIDGATVRLYKESLEVYLNAEFFGKDAQEATAKSIEYSQKLFIRLENDLKIIIVKNRYQNIKVVNAHYAEVDNELATDCNLNTDRIKIFTQDDGKLWFTIDDSFTQNEAETLHPQTAKEDMQDVVAPFFNDMREYHAKTGEKVPTMTDVISLIGLQAKGSALTAQQLKDVTGLVVELVKNWATQMQGQMSAMQPPQEEFKGRPEYIG